MPMMVIGIVGGIASGKSAVAEMCRQLGAAVVHADQIGHEVLADPQTRRRLRRRWGERVFRTDGTVNRAAIASIVFANGTGPGEIRYLEAITHPLIESRVRDKIADLKRCGVEVVVLDAPILLEAGWQRHCDRIVHVDVGRDERLRRAMQRGWTEAQFTAREATQLSVEEKRKVADVVIDNSASFDHTFAQLQQFWRSLDPSLLSETS